MMREGINIGRGNEVIADDVLPMDGGRTLVSLVVQQKKPLRETHCGYQCNRNMCDVD